MGTGSKLRPPLGQYPPAWNPNHVSALLQLGQQVNLASFPDPSKFTANPVSPKLETAHQVMPSGGSCQKRILIFDQSGDQTRLFIGPSFYQSELLLSKKKTFGGYETYNDHTQPIVEAQPNNSSPQSSCKESEMHEDSEDINALLYSDDSYANDDDDDVTSTGHSPFMEIAHEEEMASSDDGPLSKRQRLYDDCGDKKSFTDTVNSGNSPLTCSNQEKEGSSCVKGSPNESDREKRLKIRKKLKMLRGLIMGLNSDDPLVVIDEAISYLNLLRVKVKEEMRGENGV
ncbi:unnamed protein product [Cuscuta europaea]|uniref:BHLH domain-containing protein n=1 Tax=Cuscuta europaea TaxID=41803 RepID=A0A9P0YYJ7_CUSEU|nr:unnamed protein product [Cuscuta europaea]